ncbi:MAG: radical SAM family heme chaperone HemW [Clostridia bacterium]|nr:radical SAM family heme chaperone HemW [Clostridia bacterium]
MQNSKENNQETEINQNNEIVIDKNHNKNFGLYIHIPFCDSKCSYCNFVSGVYDETIKKSYFKALTNEIISDNYLCKKVPVSSIYFGGGTPSSVKTDYILNILKSLRKTYLINENAEISIECNPCSVEIKKLIEFKNAGFTRISFGAQSFDDEVLKLLGRRHNASQIFNAVQMAFDAGFENISLDFIIGAKKTDLSDFEQNILKLKKFGLKHISVYMLMLENGTKLYSEIQTGLFKPLSDDECVNEYNKIVDLLKNIGFNRYEISNFALKSFECKHNLNYWDCGEYLSFGASAHSYIKGKRIEITSDIIEYVNFNEQYKRNKSNSVQPLTKSEIITEVELKPLMKKNLYSIVEQKSNINEQDLKNIEESSIYKIEALTKKQKIEEYIMLSLRTQEGLKISKLKKLGFDIIKEKQSEIKILIEKNIITKTPSHLFVNERHFGVMNQIILKLIP